MVLCHIIGQGAHVKKGHEKFSVSDLLFALPKNHCTTHSCYHGNTLLLNPFNRNMAISQKPEYIIFSLSELWDKRSLFQMCKAFRPLPDLPQTCDEICSDLERSTIVILELCWSASVQEDIERRGSLAVDNAALLADRGMWSNPLRARNRG